MGGHMDGQSEGRRQTEHPREICSAPDARRKPDQSFNLLLRGQFDDAYKYEITQCRQTLRLYR